MTRAEIGLISPCFIVGDTPAALAFYRDRLGFEVTYQEPAEAPFFIIVQRGGAMLMLKDVGVPAVPNLKRHEWARWDAYLYSPDPDALAAEFASRQVEFSAPLQDAGGLRGFELRDPDGYVLFFGRPQPDTVSQKS
jgi:catechol 2,3-dioxygenase-like lactoylglutathione lyase family enzyme